MLTDQQQQQHPVTPPEELVQEWSDEWYRLKVRVEVGFSEYLATQAARWGADQELEACCEWLRSKDILEPAIKALRAVRRPKPPSLAEQALALINHDPDNQPFLSKKGIAIMRRALERLQELESNG